MGIGGVEAACSACNRKDWGSNPGSALLIPEVNIVDFSYTKVSVEPMQPPSSLSQMRGKPYVSGRIQYDINRRWPCKILRLL